MNGSALRENPQTSDINFFIVMSFAMAFVIAAGFSQTVPKDFGTPGIALLLHVHGMIFTLWVLLAVVQPLLIGRGIVVQHRRMGWIGTVLAAAVVVAGFFAVIHSIRTDSMTPGFPPGIFLLANSLAVLRFGGFVTAAVLLRREPEWHMRLMYCASTAVLGPGVGRLPFMGALGPLRPLAVSASVDLFILIGIGADLVKRRAIHPAYLWGLGVTFATQLLTVMLGFRPATLALVEYIRTM
ncbi:hypothetical protein BH10PSE13_BH10PSE13_06620 [soil metagenome]